MNDLVERLRGLIERLGKLEGPDQDMDAEIAVHVLGFIKTNLMAAWPDKDPIWKFTDPARNTTGSWHAMVREYTASLDAAAGLVERALPGWLWRVGRTSLFPKGWAYISRTHPSHCDREDEASCSDGRAATPAIALVIATLRALSQEQSNG